MTILAVAGDDLSENSSKAMRQEAEVKNCVSTFEGCEPYDREIRSACSTLEAHGWDRSSVSIFRIIAEGGGFKSPVMSGIEIATDGKGQNCCEWKLKQRPGTLILSR